MRRALIVAFAVVGALLLVTAQPAAAADANLEVASKNTTDTDFNAATTLTNVTVQGSGDAASVALEKTGAARVSYVDGSDNLKLADASGSTADTTANGIRDIGGVGDIDGDGDLDVAYVDSSDNIKFVDADGNVQDTGVDAGTNIGVPAVGGVADFDGDGDIDIVYRDGSENINFVDANGNTQSTSVSAQQLGGAGDVDDDDTPEIAFRDANDNVDYTDASENTVDTGADANTVGYMGDLDDDGDLDIAYLDTNQDGIEYVDSGGNVGVAIEGGNTRFNVGGVADTDNDGQLEIAYTDGDADLAFVDSSGDTQHLSVSYDDELGGAGLVGVTPTAKSSGQYVSQNHTAEQVEAVAVNLTLDNASATVEAQYWDGTQWVVANSSTYTSGGNKTLPVSASSDTWRTNVTFDAESGTTTAAMEDESVLFQASDPSGSNADPSGEVSSYDGDISLDVSDSDFGTTQGDSVQVVVENSTGGTIGSTSVSSNGTVTFPYSAPPGQSDITWTLTDSYDGDEVTVSQSFTLPSEVEIRNESDPSELVSLPNDTVEVRFYFDIEGDPQIVTRNASDGTVNMTGLPADRPFTIVVDGGDKYVSRRIFVESLYDRQTVYLLPENQTHVPTVFEVADYSGQYDQDESALLVQRAFNGSWGTVQGDLIGANERISTQLRVDERHRLVIVNAVTGDRKTLGPFTPVASGTQQIEITSDGEVSITGLGTQATISPDIGLLAARQTTITGTVRSQETDIDNATLTVEYLAPNGSTVTLATNTISGEGDVSSTVDLSGRENGTLRAQIVYNTTAGATGSATDTYDIRAATTNQYSLLSVLGTIPGLFPAASVAPFQVAVSLLLTLVLTTAAASKLRLPTEVSAVFVLVQLGVWSVIGWMPYTIPFAAGAAAVGLAAIRRGL